MIAERLRQLLNARNISLADFAEMCDLPLETVKNVYYGKIADPRSSTVLKMSQALKISVNCLLGVCQHTTDEKILLTNYRSSGRRGKDIILSVAEFEAVSTKAQKDAKNQHTIQCLLPTSSAENGVIYDTCEKIQIETTVEEAYIGIQMASNEFIPRYCKGDILLFTKRFPANGEVGGFFMNGRLYIRKYIEEERSYRLKCLHPLGEDIVLKRLDTVSYLGTCIEVIRS